MNIALNIESLRMFCRVIDEGSISKAARLGYVTQPAVTKQIHQLEARYDALLFERIDGKLIPTKAGKTLYPFARDIIETFEQSQDAIKEVTGNGEVILHVGASYTIGDYLLPKLMRDFKEKFPNYKFSLTIENTPNILSKLDNKEIDIALVESAVNNSELLVERFAEDELLVVLPANHPWQAKEAVTVSDLMGESMIWREAESGTRLIVENALKEMGLSEKMQVSMELGSIQSIKSAVEANLGISILPKLTVERELQYGILKQVGIADLTITRDLWMVRTPQRFSKEVLNQFVAFMRK